MRVLGISAHYHDSAAALVVDGKILAAVQEERFSRLKHDASFPTESIRFCLSQSPGPLDAVVFYEKPLVKFDRILSTFLAEAPRGFRAFATAIPEWVRARLWTPLEIERALEKLGLDVTGKVRFAEHHGSHAASAFFPSPFERAAWLTLDGVGEWTTTSYGIGRATELTSLASLSFPDSLGLLYSAFTYYCGFRVNSGEYKLMGLAPYGKPIYRETIWAHLVDAAEDGAFRLNPHFFGYQRGQRMINHHFEALFGAPARRPEEPLLQRHCDLARSIQEVTEELFLRIARRVRAETGEAFLCLSGGVALNCVANGRLVREGVFERVWVQPASGDAGGALGAALAYGYAQAGWQRASEPGDHMQGSFLGPSFSEERVDAALAKAGLESAVTRPVAWQREVARHVSEGAVVGLFQGRCEYGPRALGARSILGDARDPRMQTRMNLKIKFRESFRPFAPVVLAERVSDYFEWTGESPYMLFTAPVAQPLRLETGAQPENLLERVSQTRSFLPAVTHLDYSARIQTVDSTRNPVLHTVLTEFERLTGCPVMINTSFNVRGEPPVCGPEEAIAGFLETDMDVLAIEGRIVEKRRVPEDVRLKLVKRTFKPD